MPSTTNHGCLLLQVTKCKTIIRECVKFCEDAEGDKAIPSEHYDSDGELPEQFIFCAKCLKGESGEVSLYSLVVTLYDNLICDCPVLMSTVCLLGIVVMHKHVCLTATDSSIIQWTMV